MYVTLILDSGKGMPAAVAYTLVLDEILEEKYSLSCSGLVYGVGAVV